MDNLNPSHTMGGHNGASLATIQGVIEENPLSKHKGGTKRAHNLSKIESKATIRTGNAGLGSRINRNLETSSRL